MTISPERPAPCTRAWTPLTALMLLATPSAACFVDEGPGDQTSDTTGDAGSDATSGTTGTSGMDTSAGPTSGSETTGDECTPGEQDCACEGLTQSCFDDLVCIESVCQMPAPGGECGDGEVNEGEECDDGNEVDGDGCNSTCERGGKLVWERTHNGAAGDVDFAWALAVDGFGSVYVAGYERTIAEKHNAYIARFNQDGELMWERSIDSSIDEEFALAVAVDANNNAIVAGTETSLGNNRGAWISGLNRMTGATMWTASRAAESDLSVVPQDLVVDPSTGMAFVVGRTVDTDTGEPDAWVALVDPVTQSLQWEQTISAGVTRPEAANGVVLTPEGDAIVCGYYPWDEDIDDRDAWAIRIAADQSVIWDELYGSSNFDTGRDCALTPGGTLFLTSTQSSVEPEIDPGSILGHVVYRINPLTGETNNSSLLTQQVDNYAIASGTDDAIALAGEVPTAEMGIDIWLRKYDPLNNEVWTTLHNAKTGESLDSAASVGVDHNGFVFAAGGLGLINGGIDFWVAKFTP